MFEQFIPNTTFVILTSNKLQQYKFYYFISFVHYSDKTNKNYCNNRHASLVCVSILR